MEDSPLFDAGKGSIVMTRADGTMLVEMDSALEDGATKAAGAAGVVSRTKNPVRAALALVRDNREGETKLVPK